MLAQSQQSIPKIVSLYQYSKKDKELNDGFKNFIEKIKTFALFQNSIELCNNEVLQSELMLLRLHLATNTNVIFSDTKKDKNKEIPFEVYSNINKDFLDNNNIESFLVQLRNNKDFFKKWVNLGIKLELAFIVSDLYKKLDIDITPKDFEVLNAYITNNVEDFAALASFLSIWEAKNNDERQFIRNIKIKSAIFASENKQTKSITLSELSNLILQN